MAKAGRFKKGSDKLPEWFDINKYKPSKDFEASQWFDQLIIRRQLWDDLKRTKLRITDNDNFKDFTDFLNETRDLGLLKNPLKYAGEFLDKHLHRLAFPNEYGVAQANNFDIQDALGNFPAKVADAIDKSEVYETMVDSDGNEIQGLSQYDDEVLSWLYSEAITSNGILIKVDLNRSKQILIEEFENLIKELKKLRELEIEKKYRSVDFKRWYESGVLPYMDLRIWEKQEKRSFHRPSFVRELDSLLNKTVDTGILKTAKKHANLLTSIGFLEMLGYQASKEHRGLKTKSRKFKA